MSSQFESEPFSTAIEHRDVIHAAHCLLWCVDNNQRIALIQMRFDGKFGFPGGEVEESGPVTVQTVCDTGTRELVEEINYEGAEIAEKDWICSHRNRSTSFVLHFFAKQIPKNEFERLEKHHSLAQHFPSESLGLFRFPLGEVGKATSHVTRNFFANFRNQFFAGNARLQLILAARKLELIGGQDLDFIEFDPASRDASKNPIPSQEPLVVTELALEAALERRDVRHVAHCMLWTRGQSRVPGPDQSRVESQDLGRGRDPGPDRIRDPVLDQSHDQSRDPARDPGWVAEAYCLMHLREDGRLGFPGGEVDEHVTRQSLLAAMNRELAEEINYRLDPVGAEHFLFCHLIVQGERRIVCYFFARELQLEEFVERRNCEAPHFAVESLGVCRVPLGDGAYARRFLASFVRQRFPGHGRRQLLEAAVKLGLIGQSHFLALSEQVHALV